jgi:hypothetical protein
MDRFTRNYLIILGTIVAIILIAWLASLNPRVWELNDLLEDDPQLSKYPYHFEVVSLDSGVATLTTPRSSQVPAVRFLGILYPQLANKQANNPDMIAAQKELADHQARAKELILAQPDVNQVRWQIDRTWYTEHGVMLQ